MSPLPTYPRGDLDNTPLLAGISGSFWTDQFEDSDVVHAMAGALETIYEQAHQSRLEAEALLSRSTVPVYHRQLWRKVRLLEDEMNTTEAAFPVYGEGFRYGTEIRYGIGVSRTEQYIFPLFDSAVRKVRFFQNRVEDPSLVWVQGVDFDVDTARTGLVFYRNPFEDSLVPLRDVEDPVTGSIVREATLWAHMVDLDLEYLYNYVGYALGIRSSSSESYRRFLNAIWDMHSGGPTLQGFQEAVAAAAGIPLAGAAGTVAAVLTTGRETHVITEDRVYSYDEDAVPSVSVGDEVAPGDSLIEGLQIVESADALDDDAELADLGGIVLDSAFLGAGYVSSLFFKNEALPVEYLGVDSDGYAEARLELGGFPADVEMYWDRFHAEGKGTGNTLAHMLDTRETQATEPLAYHLPATYNPMKFLLGFMGNHLAIVQLTYNRIAVDAPGLAALQHLRDALAPHMTYLLFIELDLTAETVTIPDGHGNAIEVGVGLELSAESPVVTELPVVVTTVEGVLL